jgi:5,10-methylenetetrahydromethanopterin reductase
MVEFWRAGGGESFDPGSAARAAEAEGWDGQTFKDSQSLGGDPYVLMGAWAAATERLKLMTSVTNPFTRHVAVTAAAIASVQAISQGRAVLGVGRGDSALAFIGRAPVGLAAFERSLGELQTLLGGGRIDFAARGAGDDAPSLDTLSLGGRPTGSGLNWLPEGLPKTPLDVAATGPKVIEMAAAVAERVTISVGAMPERVGWALEIARAARARRGLAGDGVAYGAQIIVICHTDPEAALEMAASAVAPLARFQVIQGKVAGPVSDSDLENFAALRRAYDMNQHGKTLGAAKLIGAALSRDFIERFAIAGPPDHCIARLLDLVRCGLERFVVVGPGFYPEAGGASRSLFATEVMPAVRAEVGR